MPVGPLSAVPFTEEMIRTHEQFCKKYGSLVSLLEAPVLWRIQAQMAACFIQMTEWKPGVSEAFYRSTDSLPAFFDRFLKTAEGRWPDIQENPFLTAEVRLDLRAYAQDFLDKSNPYLLALSPGYADPSRANVEEKRRAIAKIKALIFRAKKMTELHQIRARYSEDYLGRFGEPFAQEITKTIQEKKSEFWRTVYARHSKRTNKYFCEGTPEGDSAGDVFEYSVAHEYDAMLPGAPSPCPGALLTLAMPTWRDLGHTLRSTEEGVIKEICDFVVRFGDGYASPNPDDKFLSIHSQFPWRPVFPDLSGHHYNKTTHHNYRAFLVELHKQTRSEAIPREDGLIMQNEDSVVVKFSRDQIIARCLLLKPEIFPGFKCDKSQKRIMEALLIEEVNTREFRSAAELDSVLDRYRGTVVCKPRIFSKKAGQTTLEREVQAAIDARKKRWVL